MACKLALISFQFENLDGIVYDQSLDYNFDRHDDPLPNEAIQPMVAEAMVRIKKAIATNISSMFNFGQMKVQNVSNQLHLGTMSFNTQIMHNDGSEGQTCMVVVVKVFRLDPSSKYMVSLDLEEMPSSLMAANDTHAFDGGIGNKQLVKLVTALNKEFDLKDQIEFIPLIKRGRIDKPHYLVSSDERMMEYDFDRVLLHKRSEYQDVKIVSSPSLGNTLLLDNLQNLAEVDLTYTHALMDRGHVSYKDKEVLILGGGDGGLLWELLKEKPKFVTMAEIDPVVIEACREHLRPCGKCLEQLKGENYKIIIGDCMKVLRKSISEGKKYDVIFNDLTDIPVTKRADSLTAFEPTATQKENPWHFIEAIFNLSLDCLKDDGLYMNHATGKGNTKALRAYEDFLRDAHVKVEFESRSSYVPSFMEIWVFYTVKRAKGTTIADSQQH